MNTTTPQEYLARFEEITKQMLETTRRKNKDYSGDALAFKNFETIDFLTDSRVSVEDGMLVRMTDKLTRIANLVHTDNAVKDEKITDTLLDLAIYAMIMKIYIDTK